MPRHDAAICIACGIEMPHVLHPGYRRCHECVAAERPHSLALARRVHVSRQHAALEPYDDDPARRAAA
jgi:hypothetical protein